MTTISSVSLEFLRPGPTHNQLLSRLTPYLAVCDSRPAATFSLPFDHWEMEQALSALSYRDHGNLREAQVLQVADTVGQILGSVPTLLAAVAQSQHQDPARLTHLRLVLSASELSLLPFEMSTAPQGFPGERHHLLLQPVLPITLTRELRRSPSTPVNWNRPVRVLFVAASPDGVPGVPYAQHLVALTRALQPLLCARPSELEAADLRPVITVLQNPSLHDIRQACEDTDYTHVHILAHGDSYQYAGQARFGIALCGDDRRTKHVVDGARLADALRPQRSAGRGLAVPTMVTLMTCDSGRQGSVIVPGGSLAHELHEAGIPWVLASQFPLSQRSSIVIAEELYSRLMLGEDPRIVLHALRKRLFAECPESHDWASLVAYASIPLDFDRQVRVFRRVQADRAMDHVFRHIDRLLFPRGHDPGKHTVDADLIKELHAVMPLIGRYRALVEYAAPPGQGPEDDDERAEVWGLLGAMDRNLAHIQQHQHQLEKRDGTEWRRTMARARRNYRLAATHSLDSPRYSLHYLSVSSLLGKRLPRRWWTIAYSAAQLFLRHEHRAWAYASMIELAVLALLQEVTAGSPSQAAPSTGPNITPAPIRIRHAVPRVRPRISLERAQRWARTLHRMAPDHPATRKLERQLARYRQHVLGLPPGERERYQRLLDAVRALFDALHPHRMAG